MDELKILSVAAFFVCLAAGSNAQSLNVLTGRVSSNDSNATLMMKLCRQTSDVIILSTRCAEFKDAGTTVGAGEFFSSGLVNSEAISVERAALSRAIDAAEHANTNLLTTLRYANELRPKEGSGLVAITPDYMRPKDPMTAPASVDGLVLVVKGLEAKQSQSAATMTRIEEALETQIKLQRALNNRLDDLEKKIGGKK